MAGRPIVLPKGKPKNLEPMSTWKMYGVFAVIFVCFAVLYPKIFHPLVRQLMGWNVKENIDPAAMNHPRDRMMAGGRHEHPQHAGVHPGMRMGAPQPEKTGGGGGRGGIMTVVLPIYAVGIVLYLLYTLTKVFGKKNEEEDDDEGIDVSESSYQYPPQADPRHGNLPQMDELTSVDYIHRLVNQKNQLTDMVMKAENNKLSRKEINGLQARLEQTETQMCRILEALQKMQTNVGEQASGSNMSQSSEEPPSPEKERVDGLRNRKGGPKVSFGFDNGGGHGFGQENHDEEDYTVSDDNEVEPILITSDLTKSQTSDGLSRSAKKRRNRKKKKEAAQENGHFGQKQEASSGFEDIQDMVDPMYLPGAQSTSKRKNKKAKNL